MSETIQKNRTNITSNKRVIISLLLQALIIIFSFMPLFVFDYDHTTEDAEDLQDDQYSISSVISSITSDLSDTEKAVVKNHDGYKGVVQIIINCMGSWEKPDYWIEYLHTRSGNTSSYESFNFSIGFFALALLGEIIYCVVYLVNKFKKVLSGSAEACSFVPSLVLSITIAIVTVVFNSWFAPTLVIPSCFLIIVIVLTILEIVLKIHTLRNTKKLPRFTESGDDYIQTKFTSASYKAP